MGVNNGKTTFVLSSRLYDVGKKLVLVILPAISAAYFGLGAVWGLPGVKEVVGTLAVITTFLGTTLHISNSQYKSSGAAYDGTVTATPTDEGTNVKFSVDPHDLVNKDAVTLKVESPGPQ
jgi:hypothetical protein